MNVAEAPMQTPEPPNTYWSLNKASKELGINKSTLSTDAAKGKIQWHDQQDGSKKFFVPELYSFYSQRLKDRTERAERLLNGVHSPDTERHEHSQNNELNTALDAKAEIVALLKAQLEETRHDRDQWRKQAEDTSKQLTEALTVIKALPAPAATAEPEQPVKRRKFLGLFG
jgi:chromosome segregation ATPase